MKVIMLVEDKDSFFIIIVNFDFKNIKKKIVLWRNSSLKRFYVLRSKLMICYFFCLVDVLWIV